MKALLLLFSFSLLYANACGGGTDPEDADDFTIGQSCTLEPGQRFVNRTAGLEVTWQEVSEDSRCPRNANCVWEGQAVVNLLVNGEAVALTLRQGKPEQAQRTVANYVFTAEELSPYPEGEQIEADAYRLQLMVSSL